MIKIRRRFASPTNSWGLSPTGHLVCPGFWERFYNLPKTPMKIDVYGKSTKYTVTKIRISYSKYSFSGKVIQDHMSTKLIILNSISTDISIYTLPTIWTHCVTDEFCMLYYIAGDICRGEGRWRSPRALLAPTLTYHLFTRLPLHITHHMSTTNINQHKSQ